MNQIIGLVLAMFLVSPLAFAADGGDVCNIRPDLCDETGSTPEPEVAETVVRRHPQQRKVVRPSAQKRKLKPRKANTTRRSSSTANCRVAGEPYNLNNVDLPICKSANVADSEQEESRSPKAKKASARRSPASSIDIDSYMNANAKHPAFANRLSERQQAFQDPVPRPAAPEAAASNTTAAVPAAAPAPAAGY